MTNSEAAFFDADFYASSRGMPDPRKFDLVYLGSPYSKFPRGIEMAFIEVCRIAASFVELGVNVYSPIAHTHPIAIHGKIDPLDVAKWLRFDTAMMQKSDAMIVAQMEGWEHSSGIAHEIQVFRAAQKPILYFHPESTEINVSPVAYASDSVRNRRGKWER